MAVEVAAAATVAVDECRVAGCSSAATRSVVLQPFSACNHEHSNQTRVRLPLGELTDWRSNYRWPVGGRAAYMAMPFSALVHLDCEHGPLSGCRQALSMFPIGRDRLLPSLLRSSPQAPVPVVSSVDGAAYYAAPG